MRESVKRGNVSEKAGELISKVLKEHKKIDVFEIE